MHWLREAGPHLHSLGAPMNRAWGPIFGVSIFLATSSISQGQENARDLDLFKNVQDKTETAIAHLKNDDLKAAKKKLREIGDVFGLAENVLTLWNPDVLQNSDCDRQAGSYLSTGSFVRMMNEAPRAELGESKVKVEVL